jgi:hypothetical protein
MNDGYCEAHLVRTGEKIPVYRVSLCRACFQGKELKTGQAEFTSDAGSQDQEQPNIATLEPVADIHGDSNVCYVVSEKNVTWPPKIETVLRYHNYATYLELPPKAKRI